MKKSSGFFTLEKTDRYLFKIDFYYEHRNLSDKIATI